jgi:hypothetical protein
LDELGGMRRGRGMVRKREGLEGIPEAEPMEYIFMYPQLVP